MGDIPSLVVPSAVVKSIRENYRLYSYSSAHFIYSSHCKDRKAGKAMPLPSKVCRPSQNSAQNVNIYL